MEKPPVSLNSPPKLDKMQNKPNSRKVEMNITSYSKKDYEMKNAFSLPENKPNQTRFSNPAPHHRPHQKTKFFNFAYRNNLTAPAELLKSVLFNDRMRGFL